VPRCFFQFLALISYPELRPIWDPRTQEAKLLERYSQYEVGFYSVQRGFGWIGSPRDIVGVQDTVFHDNGKIERIQTSVPDNVLPPVSGRVRATLTLAGWVLKPHSDGTEVTYVVKINPNGSLPLRIINGTIIPEIPAAIVRCDETLRKDGYPPFLSHKLRSTLRTESFISRTYTVALVGKAGDNFDICYDIKMYHDNLEIRVDGQGKDGVKVSRARSGLVHVAIGDDADGCDVIVVLT